MAYRHSIGEINPERDGPERDGPEGDGPKRDGPERDGPKRDDQLSTSGRNQLSMSPDEQGYIRPHNLAIHQKTIGKKYYIYSKSHVPTQKGVTNSQ